MLIGARIALFDAPEPMLKALKTALSLKNPAYYQALKRSPNGRCFLSPLVKYYEHDKKTGIFYCGRGMEQRIRDYCEKHEIELEDYERTAKPHYPTHSTITLRPYQEGVPEQIAAGDHGIIRMDTGSGKTVVMLRVAELLQTTALFIVPKKSIMGQFVADIEKYFGFKPGVIGDGTFDVQPFTVATMQTLQRKIESMPKEFADNLSQYFGSVFVDECHTTVPKKSRRVVESFAARHLYGATATNRRTDEQGEALDFMFGPVLVDVKMERAIPRVDILSYKGKIAMGEYGEIIEDQTKDYERNKLIAARVVEEISLGRRVLVLTKRIEHCEKLLHELHELAPERADSIIALRSSGSTSARMATMADLRSGVSDFAVLLGTFSLLGTGMDCPALDTLVIAGDLKSDILQEQSVGRIQRLFEGKPDPLVIDVADDGNPILKRQAKAREQFYKEQNWIINKK